ncbi:hypothetical protein ACFQZT_14655 [Paenibacillus sp. GCM10027628]|uniref:hypothetical protein n=1 Tax=Paenibacillus sp. GCM10027628 TaxID=3273413 RepID=UPI003632E8FB
MSVFKLNLRDGDVEWGTQLDIDSLLVHSKAKSINQHNGGQRTDWNLPAGIYRAKDIVSELDTLLQAILIQLGDAANAETLLNTLEANLAIEGRESSLPLGSLAFGDKAGIELTKQAQEIGEALTRWARENHSRKEALERYGHSALNELQFRSKCNNHLWTPKATGILTGPHGGPIVMQLYNEYLHQFVLLRNALIVFDNWEEVPIEITEREDEKGLRFIEDAHTEFLSALLAKRLTHKSIVRFAQRLLSPRLTTIGYGFQYKLGTILPASLSSEPETASRYLLHWYPVQTSEHDYGTHELPSVSFDYGYSDYYAAPRSETKDWDLQFESSDWASEAIERANLIVNSVDADRILINYRLQWSDGSSAEVDLGQAFRGQRFMYLQKSGSKDIQEAQPFQQVKAQVHHPKSLLGLPGLVTNDSGVHFVKANDNPLVKWALLGKLYPENVILLESAEEDSFADAGSIGKGFGTKFLIW